MCRLLLFVFICIVIGDTVIRGLHRHMFVPVQGQHLDCQPVHGQHLDCQPV